MLHPTLAFTQTLFPGSASETQSHVWHIYLYIYMCVCVCVCGGEGEYNYSEYSSLSFHLISKIFIQMIIVIWVGCVFYICMWHSHRISICLFYRGDIKKVERTRVYYYDYILIIFLPKLDIWCMYYDVCILYQAFVTLQCHLLIT